MEERLFYHLLKNEPGVIELTKKQYDDYRALEQHRGGGQDSKDVEEILPEAPAGEVGASFSGTKAQIEAELRKRGFTPSELRGKRKSELEDML